MTLIDNQIIQSLKTVTPVQSKARGFTLIELLIVVAIVGILATIAYPSFVGSIRKARREDGRVLLQAALLAQEKYRLSNATYADTAAKLLTVSKLCASSASCLSTEGHYLLEFPAGSTYSATAFTMQVTPQGSQTNDTACGTSTPMTVVYAAGAVTKSPTDCWNK